MTSKSILFSILFLLFAFTSFSQQSNFRLPQQGLQELSREAESRIRAGETFPSQNISQATIQPGAGQLLSSGIISRGRQIKLPAVSSRSANSDTLFVLDTMNISGDWFYQGTIVIALSGQIRFKNANATILGDIYLFGDHALLQADSSNLYIPQAYFYQRVIFATGGSKVSFRHTTVDHSDLSHNIILVDSATLELIDVTNKGFTTNGIYADARVFVDGTNQAGEYVILDRSKLEFRNANTVL
ncbi:MAG: hypothetical protein IPH88_14055, partial [Bacteroidales bacterium]|nr:hypothetical protein [Bacteroidales bacterium]